MRQIRSKNTRPEIAVRKYLHSKGLRFRVHDKKLPGCPDIVLRKYSACIFLHGCFWHGHVGCNLFRYPKTNKSYWRKKIKDTQLRDLQQAQLLKCLGWRVFVIWECDQKKSFKIVDRVIEKIKQLKNHSV